MWKWETVNGINYISLNSWVNDGVKLAFTDRAGGNSEGDYKSLNMGLHVGDTREMVLENRRLFLDAFNINLEDAVCCQQVHGNKVIRVGLEDKGKGAAVYDTAIPGVDGLITDTPGVALLTYYADCVPLYFFDPIHRVIGLSHAGWKGTISNIVKSTLDEMKCEFGTKPDDIRAFIGSGIDACCFQIDDELAERVKNKYPYFHGIISENNNNEVFWNLKDTNRHLLIENGVKKENITICALCTCCEKRFFSYRREKGNTGRMAAMVVLV
ncbi:MAG: peptidoglycan editing factor PgeF [Bacillota bacterium]|nr:peptidoglycan editing factor PgeF [Bacillota bacterium]